MVGLSRWDKAALTSGRDIEAGALGDDVGVDCSLRLVQQRPVGRHQILQVNVVPIRYLKHGGYVQRRVGTCI